MRKQIIITAVSFALASVSGLAGDIDAKVVWDKQCKKCHAEDGSGKTKLGEKLDLKDYTDPAALADMTDEQLFAATADGVEGSKMKGYRDKLSEEEINALILYMREMAK